MVSLIMLKLIGERCTCLYQLEKKRSKQASYVMELLKEVITDCDESEFF